MLTMLLMRPGTAWLRLLLGLADLTGFKEGESGGVQRHHDSTL